MQIILDRDVQTPTKKYLGKYFIYSIGNSEATKLCLFTDKERMAKQGIGMATLQNKINNSNPGDNIRKALKQLKRTQVQI